MKITLRIVIIILLIHLIHSCKKEEVPSVLTAEVTNIFANTATSGGSIVNEGSGSITGKGVCWSKGTEPTLADSRTNEGTGARNFISKMFDLEGGRNYFVRAYATNSAGIGYGTVISFATRGQLPFAETHYPTNVSSSGVTLNGTVNPNYLSTVVTFEYGTTNSYERSVTVIPNPLTRNTLSNVSATVFGLNPGTTYHFRIKATNSAGTVCGEDFTFIQPFAVIDVDFNIYQTVSIGNQTWMSENLKTTKYNDGAAIPLIADPYAWLGLVTPSYCWLNDSIKYKDINGALYNWYAVNTGKLCPLDWHVPTYSEWWTLNNYLETKGYNYDGTVDGNKYAKALASTEGWESSSFQGAIGNTDYSGYRNKSGFTAVWCGSIGNGIFNNEIGKWCGWWSSSTGGCECWWPTGHWDENDFAWIETLVFTGADVPVHGDFKHDGVAVRCLKDN